MPVTQSMTSNIPADLKGSVPVTPFARYVNNRRVTTVSETETVPAGATQVVIAPTGADLWIRHGAVAVAGVSDVTDGTGSILIKEGVSRALFVSPADTFGMITAAGTADVSLEYYAR